MVKNVQLKRGTRSLHPHPPRAAGLDPKQQHPIKSDINKHVVQDNLCAALRFVGGWADNNRGVCEAQVPNQRGNTWTRAEPSSKQVSHCGGRLEECDSAGDTEGRLGCRAGVRYTRPGGEEQGRKGGGGAVYT